MSDDGADQYLADLEQAFSIAKQHAIEEAERRNSRLSLKCRCGEETYIPGLVCFACGWCAEPDDAWLVVRDGEWGYELVPISKRVPIASFSVEM